MPGSTQIMPAYLTHSLKVQGQTKDIMSLVEVVTCICDIYTWSIYSRWTYLLRMFHDIEDLVHPLEFTIHQHLIPALTA